MVSPLCGTLSPSLQLEWVRQYKDSHRTFVVAVVRSAKTASKLLEIADDNVAIVEVDMGRADTFEVSHEVRLRAFHPIINFISTEGCKIHRSTKWRAGGYPG